MEITKDMSLMKVLSIYPGATNVLIDNGITKAKVLESLEKNIVAAGKNVDEILGMINSSFEEAQKPIELNPDEILEVTEEAVKAFKTLLERKNKKGWSVRVIIHSPSPNVYSYAMDFEKRPAKDDIVIQQHGMKFFIKKSHALGIKGTKIDYDKEADGFKFGRIENS